MKASDFDKEVECVACEDGLPDYVQEVYESCPICEGTGTYNPRQGADGNGTVLEVEFEKRGGLVFVRQRGITEETLDQVYGSETVDQPDEEKHGPEQAKRMAEASDLTPDEAAEHARKTGNPDHARMLEKFKDKV